MLKEEYGNVLMNYYYPRKASMDLAQRVVMSCHIYFGRKIECNPSADERSLKLTLFNGIADYTYWLEAKTEELEPGAYAVVVTGRYAKMQDYRAVLSDSFLIGSAALLDDYRLLLAQTVQHIEEFFNGSFPSTRIEAAPAAALT